MRDANDFAVAYVYFESEPSRRAAANLMNKDEARTIAATIAKLPEGTGAKKVTPGLFILTKRPASGVTAG